MAFFGHSLSQMMAASDVIQFNTTISRQRLDTARGEGIAPDQLFFDDDGLLAWDGMRNYTDGYDYHTQVQTRLLQAHIRGLTDPMVRESIRDASNAKLEEALQLGIAIHDIRIGSRGMPEWDQEAVDHAVPLTPQPVEDHEEDSVERDMLTFGVDFVRAHSREMDIFPDDITPALSEDTSTDDESSDSWDTSSDESSSAMKTHEELDDDRYVYALVANGDFVPLPASAISYWEGGDDAPNVIRDVEIYGGPDGTYLVDMEVNEAENDSNLSELPEAELAVDATAYEFFFPTGEAVDANLPGKMLEVPMEDEDEMMGL